MNNTNFEISSSNNIIDNFDRSKKNYEGISDTLKKISEQITELDLPLETERKWKIMLGATRIIDDKVDEITDEKERDKFSTNIIDILNGSPIDESYEKNLYESFQKIKQLLNELKESDKLKFITIITRVLKLTEALRTETDVKKFINLSRIEGQVFARSISIFLPEEYKRSDKYNKLMKALTRIGRMGNSFDNIIDLKDDYKKGRTAIKPTFSNRLRILSYLLLDGKGYLKDVGSSNIAVGQLIKKVIHVMERNSEKDKLSI